MIRVDVVHTDRTKLLLGEVSDFVSVVSNLQICKKTLYLVSTSTGYEIYNNDRVIV